MRSCLTCGDQSPVGAHFCIGCGAVMSLASEGPTQRISAGLAAEGPTQHLPLRSLSRRVPILLLFGIDILILYSALILWPSYESGMAWFEGSPKGEFDAYKAWYMSWIPFQPFWLREVVGLLIGLTVLVSLLAAWLLLLPLAFSTLLWLGENWSKLLQRERIGILVIGVLEIVVPVLTWTASRQFLIWFAD